MANRSSLLSARVLPFVLGAFFFADVTACAVEAPPEPRRSAHSNLEGDGVTCTREANIVVRAVYRQILQREPDAGGAANAESVLKGGVKVKELVRGTLKSPEYKQRFLYNGIIDAVYGQILDRPADPVGLAGSVTALDAGSTVRDLVVMTVSSPEYAQRFIAPLAPAAAVRRLYQRVLAREPESEAVVEGHATTALTLGWPSVIPAFTAEEYAARFGAWSVPGAVGEGPLSVAAAQLYLSALARNPESAAAIAGHVAVAKAQGWNADIDGFVDSDEYATRFGADGVPGATPVRYCR